MRKFPDDLEVRYSNCESYDGDRHAYDLEYLQDTVSALINVVKKMNDEIEDLKHKDGKYC